MPSKKILLVQPNMHAEWKGLTPHVGQGYLAQTLQDNGIDYDVLDMNLGYDRAHLHRKIKEFQPDLVGLSLVSMEYKDRYRMITEIKAADQTIKVVVGGPHVTILKEQVLRDCPAIDYGITFEGEQTLLELCSGTLPDNRIQGLLIRDHEQITYTGDRGFQENLDLLPWPKYHKFELKKYAPEVTIYSSRGCPHQCIFCPNRLISPVFRARGSSHVVDEMEYWYRQGRRQFNFDDDNFNLERERVFQICDEIERREMKDLILRCSNGIRADKVDREMLIRMKQVGFKYIAYGADAGNNKMLKIIKKNETIEDIEQAVKLSCELGFGVKLLYVTGTPYETREDVEDKVRLARKFPIQDVHFYNIIPYPGTELFDWVTENKYFLRQPEDYLNDVSSMTHIPLFETPELPKEKRMELYTYLNKVRLKIHQDAFMRLFRWKTIGFIASRIMVNEFTERLFYQNTWVRKTAERFRYQS
jgi:radical SAM superfamily enzyme YgiQ (UPF0313 family)